MSTVAVADRNLPALPGGLVGRERDVAEVASLLTSVRLVSVVGPTGVGKTRLAVAVATQTVDRFPDGVWLVELAAATRPADVAAAVASTLAVDTPTGPLSTGALVHALRHRRLLLILDNCEHLVQACAELADQLVSGCPQLSILVTSQEALAVTGEWVWHLHPLAIPAPDTTDLAELADCPAVRLFVERAIDRRPDFALTAENAPAVAEICRRLDGVPLALELAAGRVAALGAAELVPRLDERFELLTGDAGGLVPRHQTLVAALDWSHDLLTEPERTLLRRLAVFAGGCTLDAAEAVCAGGDVSAGEVLDLLAALVGRSLVVADTGSPSRYRLLDSTRAYAHDRLVDAGEAAEMEAAHAAWCAALAERADPELAAGAQRTWLARLDTERPNLRAALSSATAAGDAELALRLAGALVMYWSMRGRFKEGMAWLEAALAVEGGSTASRARALWGAGLLARALGEHPVARARVAKSLDLARRLDDPRLVARALSVLGAVGVSACDGSTMDMEMLDDSLAMAREVGDVWCEVGSLVSQGFGHLVQGDPAAARACFQACLDVAERHDDEASDGHRVHALTGLGRAALAAGDHATAERLLAEAATLARALGLVAPAANALRFLGETATTRGDYTAARHAFEQSLDLGRRTGASVATALALSALGRLALSQGDTAAATRVLEEARALGVAEGLGAVAACALTGLGAVERALGDAPEARIRLDEALATARQAGDREAAAKALHELGRVAAADDDSRQAVALLHEALVLYGELGDEPAIAGCLEALARLEAEEGGLQAAARLLGAAQAVRDAGGYARAPADQPDYDADVALVRRALGPEQFQAAWAEGSAVTVDEAVRYAARGRGPRRRTGRGWDALTEREREAVQLAAQRLTNPQIAQRMLVSPRTVQSHLGKAYAKLGVSSRRELADTIPDAQPV